MDSQQKEKEKIIHDRMAYSINLGMKIKAAEKSMRDINAQVADCKKRLAMAKSSESSRMMHIYQNELTALEASYERVADNLTQLNVLKSQVAAHASDTDLMDSVETLILLSAPLQNENTTMLKKFNQYKQQQTEAARVRASVATKVTGTYDANATARVSQMQEEQSQKVTNFLAMTTFGTVTAENSVKDLQQQ